MDLEWNIIVGIEKRPSVWFKHTKRPKIDGFRKYLNEYHWIGQRTDGLGSNEGNKFE